MTNIDDLIDRRAPFNGDFSETARISQNIKAMFHDSPNWKNLSVIQMEALEMLASKIARVLNGDSEHPDHWLDIQGYSRLVYTRVTGGAAVVAKRIEDPRAAQPATRPTLKPLVTKRADFASAVEKAIAEADDS